MNADSLLGIIDECDGWTIHCPDGLKAMGLPDWLADQLTACYESNPLIGAQSLYVDGERVNQLPGIYSLDLLVRLAAIVHADTSSVRAVGRGTRAEQLKDSIRAKLKAREERGDA